MADSSSKTIKDKLAGAAASVSGAAQKVVDAAKSAPETVAGAFGAVTGALKDGIQRVEDGIHDARTLTANTVSTGGKVVGVGGGLVGEVLLLTGGILPFLVFGGLPSKLGGEIADAIDGVAKVIRGSRPEFIGINYESPGILQESVSLLLLGGLAGNGSVSAMIYDPTHPHQDSGGILRLSERDIVHQLKIMSNSRAAREPAYKVALIAVQEAKKHYKISLDTPDIRFKKDWSYAPVSPKVENTPK